ncbi:MAG: two-component regulator propeller domain-containing protein [Bacteroidota bacterium]
MLSQAMNISGQNLTFFHYGLAEGMSDPSVGAILQDRTGFIWVGTDFGLNRFDGLRFKTYLHDTSDSLSLSANSISCLFEASTGHIWVGTRGGGISVYDPTHERFTRMLHKAEDSSSLSNNYINHITADSEGHIWIATENGLNELISDPQYPQAAAFRTLQLPFSHIYCMAEWPRGTYWIGTDRKGVLRYEKASQQIERYVFDINNKSASPIPFNIIQAFYVDTLDGHNNLWIATLGGVGQVSLDSSQKYVFQKYRTNLKDSTTLPHYRISHILRNDPQTLWFASFQGLIQATETENGLIFSQIKHDPGDPNSLRDDMLHHLYLDETGNLWLATHNGLDMTPVKYLSQNVRAFNHQLLPLKNGINPIQHVTATFEDKEGNLWLGTYGFGLLLRHKASGKDYYFDTDALPSEEAISHGIVTKIDQDEEGIFSIATFGGFNRMVFTDSTGVPKARFTSFVHDEYDSTSLSDNHIFAIYDDKKGGIWLGTRGGGLNRFDKKTQTFQSYQYDSEDPNSINNNYVWDIQPDRQFLWLATDGGLNRMDLHTHTFRAFVHEPTQSHSLSNNFLNCLRIDQRGKLWVGTNSSGIAIMEDLDRPGTFTHIRKRDGLTHNQVYDLIEDYKGDIWVPTGQGLSRISHQLDPTMDAPASYIQNFDKRDGLQDNEFESGAGSITQTGRLILGGSNGYNQFHPDSIRKNQMPPKVVIASFYKDGELLQPGLPASDGRRLLSQDETFGTLSLNHKDLVIDIEFAALNYLFPEKNQYAYRLRGFNDSWTFVTDRPKATYTKLPSGNYIFEVKASNNDGVWNEVGTQLAIVVAPPPWRSGWAYLLYFLLGASLVYAYIQYRVNQKARALQNQLALEQARLQERELVLKNASADYHDELGNKMTKISLFVELAKRQEGVQDMVHTYLQQIESNTQQLSEGMRDFIWMLDPEKNSLFDLVSRVKDYAEQLFIFADIVFEIKGLQSSLSSISLTLAQRRHLMLIIKEALNNTVKYAEAKHVSLNFHLTARFLHLHIMDDGRGFDPQAIKDGYGLKNMASRAEKIQAQFRLDTQPHKGTHIHISFEIPHMEDGIASDHSVS